MDSLEMGFLPVPGLDPKRASTSYKVRGQGLRVDLLTPAGSRSTGPVNVRRLNAAAQPLRFLDLVTEGAVRAAVVDGGATSVTVPDPACFALHKLIVAGEGPASMHAKRDKDLLQAAEVFEVLLAERPGDVSLAWEAVAGRGRGWVKRARAGLAAMRRVAPETEARLVELLG